MLRHIYELQGLLELDPLVVFNKIYLYKYLN
jgi:hypothetical protein